MVCGSKRVVGVHDELQEVRRGWHPVGGSVERASIHPPQLPAVRGTEFGASTLALNGHCYRPARLEDRTHGGGAWERHRSTAQERVAKVDCC